MERFMDYLKNISKGKLVTFFVLVVLILATVIFCWDYFVTQKTVTLSPTPNTTIAMYQQTDDSDKGPEIVKTSVQKEIRLRPGSYLVKYSGSKDYQEESETVLIDKPTELITPKLNYTNDKLIQILESEKSAIHVVLSPSIPNPKYYIKAEALFGEGDWYAAQLMPKDWYSPNVPKNIIPRPTNDNNTLDILKVIMKKDSDQWKIVVGPSIVIAISDYPDIPQDVIRSANKLGIVD